MRRSRGRRKRRKRGRQKRRVRKPQITTINHQAVNVFTCSDGPLLASAWDLCVCISHVCMCARSVLPSPDFSSLSRCLRLSLNWRHKQQQLRNHPRQQEAGRCVNSPSTKLGCARLQKRLGSRISLFNHKHLHEPGWKHTLGCSQGFALDAGQGFRSRSPLQKPNWDLCLLAWEKNLRSAVVWDAVTDSCRTTAQKISKCVEVRIRSSKSDLLGWNRAYGTLNKKQVIIICCLSKRVKSVWESHAHLLLWDNMTWSRFLLWRSSCGVIHAGIKHSLCMICSLLMCERESVIVKYTSPRWSLWPCGLC